MYTESHCSSISDRFDAIHKETVLFPSALISMTVNKVFSLRYFHSKKKKQNLNLQKKKEKKEILEQRTNCFSFRLGEE